VKIKKLKNISRRKRTRFFKILNINHGVNSDFINELFM